jgi:DNA-binding transcriptional LysR family regulator
MAKSLSKAGKSKQPSSPTTSTLKKLVWLEEPAEHDYPSAASFLSLVARGEQVEALTALLSQAPTVRQAAKDILRAAGLPLLAVDDPEVAKDLARVADGVALSPVLLVRGDIDTGRKLMVADGYHRVCAGYHLDEDSAIPCRIVGLPPMTV